MLTPDGRTDGRSDEQTDRRKLYSPRHTSYAGGITSSISSFLHVLCISSEHSVIAHYDFLKLSGVSQLFFLPKLCLSSSFHWLSVPPQHAATKENQK